MHPVQCKTTTCSFSNPGNTPTLTLKFFTIDHMHMHQIGEIRTLFSVNAVNASQIMYHYFS
jgi:hypothetical protein